MRRTILSIAVVSLLVVGLPAAAASAPNRLAPGLAQTLPTVPSGDLLRVFVHARDVGTAARAVTVAGLVPLTTLDAVDVAVGWGTPAAIRRVAALPGVTYVEGDAPLTFQTDSSHVATRGLEARRRVDARRRAIDGRGVSIAIVDSGVDGSHPMFRRNGVSAVRRNLKDICAARVPSSPYPDRSFNRGCWVTAVGNDSDTLSGAGHGTHVAGIAAGRPIRTSGGRTVQGAAPGATIIALGVGAGPSVYGSAAALNWILQHRADPCGDRRCPAIRVVNNSYSRVGGGYDPNGVIEKLQQRLVTAGVVMVWAAGNSGGKGDRIRTNTYTHTSTGGVISVANYDDGDTGSRHGELNDSSSRGKSGEPATYPDISAPGTRIASACRIWLFYCTLGADWSDTRVARMSGTSMAAPHVAGIVAQVLQANPRLTPANVEDILEDTARPFAFGAPYEPDPANAGTRTSFDKGHGLVDAAAAVDRALAVASR